MISPARTVAFDILMLVERGGYASDLLLTRAAGLDTRDAGLASELVLGSIRIQAQLDFLIHHFSGHDADWLDPEIRIALRLAIYQLRYLTRIPAHAAVSESVELVKRARKRSAVGLTNAVLRKVNRHSIAWPDRATELSMPAWLLERWDREHGAETAEAMARAALAPPETFVRVPGNLPCGVTLEPTEVEGCYRVAAGDPTGLRVQDIGSQSIVPLLDLAPGQSFLDVCAAPGNKTAQALEAGVHAVACDLHLSRLEHMKDLGCPLVVLNGARPLPFKGRFDRILVDAPCSGTGTLARNPEIRWRLRPEDISELHTRQVKLLRNALELLAPGGRLVYSTCSIEREENEDVVDEVGPRVLVLRQRLPGRDRGDGFFAAMITSG